MNNIKKEFLDWFENKKVKAFLIQVLGYSIKAQLEKNPNDTGFYAYNPDNEKVCIDGYFDLRNCIEDIIKGLKEAKENMEREEED